MLSDLSKFKENIYTQHLTFDLSSPNSALDATKNVQNVKDSLDAWRAGVKARLDAVDVLCHESADTMTPEQFALLREKRNQLAADYDNVVRTVEGVYARLNVIASLLVEFSSQTSSMQSWITDKTREAADVKAESADPKHNEKTTREARSLLDEVSREESRLKAIGSVVTSLEREIDALYAEAPGMTERNIHSDDVRQTMYRVQDDYAKLLKQCQDLIQFQNRVATLAGDSHENFRKLDDWLSSIEGGITELNSRKDLPVDQKMKLIDQLSQQASDDGRISQAEQSSLRWLLAVEDSGIGQNVKDKQQNELENRKKRHAQVASEIQSRLNDVSAERAANEGVRQAVDSLSTWVEGVEQKLRIPVDIPLKEHALNELSRETKQMGADLDSRLVVLDQLDREVGKMTNSEDMTTSLAETRQRLARSKSQLKGFGDNVSDALSGLQNISLLGESLGRNCDAAGVFLHSTNPRDASRLSESSGDIERAQGQMEQLKEKAKAVKDIPRACETERVDQMVADAERRVKSLADLFEQKRKRCDDVDQIEAQFDDARAHASEWLGAFDGNMIEMGPVSVALDKLKEQRKQCSQMAENHRQGQPMLEEVEQLAFQLAEVESAAGNRASSIPRHAMDLLSRYNQQTEALRNRGDKINRNEQKAAELEDTQNDIGRWIDVQTKALDDQAGPSNKDAIQALSDQLDRVEKAARQEQRRVEEAHLRSRELARSASFEGEANDVIAVDEQLTDRWNNFNNQIEGARLLARKSEQLVDGCGQLDKWLAAKGRLLEVIGAPSTDAALARSQIGQLQIMKTEAENEKSSLDRLNGMSGAIAAGGSRPDAVQDLIAKIDDLNNRWASFEDDLKNKEDAVHRADELGKDIKRLQKDVKREISELESGIEQAAGMTPGEVDKQLAALDKLKQRFSGLDGFLGELEQKLSEAEELDVDPASRADIQEHVDGAKKRADELDQKIDGVKRAALSARDEGEALDQQIDALLAVARAAESEIHQAPAISADSQKISENQQAVDGILSTLLGKEGDVSLIKAKVADKLKNKHDPHLKNKSDELHQTWNPLVAATKDRRNALAKVSDLVKQFNDMESTLSDRLKEDEKEMESIIAGDDKAAISDALRMMDNVLGRRMADAEALSGLASRIETAAPGPDANKLRRKADNLLDDCKGLSKKAKTAANASQKKVDLLDKLDRLLSEAGQFAASQKAVIEDGTDVASKDRVHNKIAEVDAFWTRKHREIRACADELATVSDEPEKEKTSSAVSALAEEFARLLDSLRSLDSKLGERQDMMEKARDKTNRLAQDANNIYNEISDLDPVGRSSDELARQRSECLALEGSLDEVEAEVKSSEAAWDDALADGSVQRPQWEANKTALDNIHKLLGRSRKKLAQRSKKIDQIEEEVEQIEKDAAALTTELEQLKDSDILSSPLDVSDPKKQSEQLKQLKDAVRPLGHKVDNFLSECKVLIKSAGPDTDTAQLDDSLGRVSNAWAAVSAAVAERELAVDAAVQQMGRYEDAHKALLNWLEETEEMLENQRPPAADAKVAKAQLHAYDVLLKHIEDKETSVNGFAQLIEKIAELAPSQEEKNNLRQKQQGVDKRYNDLLAGAHDRQTRLMEAVDLAERLTEGTVPLENWLAKAEKRLQGLSSVAADSDKMDAQLESQKELEVEIYNKGEDVDNVLAIVPMLCALVSVDDANQLEVTANNLASRYESLANRTRLIKDILADVAGQVGDFQHDTNALAAWLDEMEARLLDMDELAIEPDDLIEQSNILTDLAVAVTERDALVSSVLAVGRELSKQTSADEAIALQNRVESLKMRYADMMSVADEKLALLSKAIPLSERFHDGFDDVMQWVEAVEEDLQHVDEADIETQAQLIFTMEEDVTRWRPEVDELVAVSNQLQTLSGPERADELYQNTLEMNKRVNQIADKVSRRAERLDLTEKQSRAVLDELEFLVEWLSDARDRVVVAGPPSIDPEFVKAQLRNQRIMNDDVTANKGRLREVVAEAKKVIRQLGSDGSDSAAFAALEEKCEHGKQLVDEVAALCMDRTEILERAMVLAGQLTSEFEELSSWVDQVDDELRAAPEITTTTPANELRRMHDHNSELLATIVSYKPIVDRFDLDVKSLQELCSEHEAAKLGELADEIIGKYNDVKNAARGRGQALDSTLDATSGFGERLDHFVQNLQGAAERLREIEGISADPVILEEKLAENQAILDSLRQKETAYATLRDSANELLAAAPHGDLVAQDVTGKLDRLEKLWRDIEKEAAVRGEFLENVLPKAKHFWSELDQCQKAVDDLRVRLETVEPAICQPEQLQIQQVAMTSVAGEMTSTAPRIAALKQAGDALASVIPAEEQAVVHSQVDAVHDGWNTITRLFADKNRDLVAAMEEAMSFHGDLGGLLSWLEGAERHVQGMTPVEQLKIEDIPSELESLYGFKSVVDEHGIVKEQLAQTATRLVQGAPAHHAAAVRQPISELNHRWARLYGALAEREHKMEKALLQMGRLAEAADQLIAWMDRTRTTLDEFSTGGPRNLRRIEIQLAKLAVLKNDVHSHEPSVATLNAAAQRLLAEESDSTTAAKIDQMNGKWRRLQEDLERLAIQMETAKSEAESVGGELERWLSWVDDVESQLLTTKPTGGLPESASEQMDEFRVLRAEVEQNAPALEEYLRETERYLVEHGNDNESWVGRNHGQMKTKWNKVKELCVDREKKLQLALAEAESLDVSMRATAAWLTQAEKQLASMPAVSRILDTVEQQLAEQQLWLDEVATRKQLMVEQHAAGTRLQYYCEKKDAIPIKNGLVSLKHRFEKVASRSNERMKQLTLAAEETRVWVSGLEGLVEWMDEVEADLVPTGAETASLVRLKEQLEQSKQTQKAIQQRQPQYETTVKRGVALAEHAPKQEAKIINQKNNDLSKRWSALSSLSVQRGRSAEQAVLEGGEFEEAMEQLEGWVDGELARMAAEDNDKVGGDIDTVRELRDAEKVHDSERKAKKQGVDTVLRKAAELSAKGVEESAAVSAAADRLGDKWSRLEDAARVRASSLDDATRDAEEFDAKAHAMLDWLAAQENKLKGPSTDISAALSAVNAVKAELDVSRPKMEECLEKGRGIQKNCHPRADQPLKHWIRVVDSRWKEVEEKASEREFTLLEEEQRESERDEAMKELRRFVQQKKEQLAAMTALPPADDLDTLDKMQKEHEQLDFELRERQADVDDAIKGSRKGTRNPAAEHLSSDWKQLWLDSLGHQSSLENQRALLEETKRLEGWKWEEWKERYVEFNDHGKARVTDLFRRIDRSHTGKVPRNVFIDAIIASKFPTSRLEMAKVADLFDKGDGLVDSKMFINALRFDMANRSREPITDHEKINEEMVKQKNACSCCQQYKIEKISEGHYRFGETQIKRMVRILRSTVMVRVGGGWEALDEFLSKHDPCRAKGRLNINMFYKDVAPSNAIDTMRAFTKGRHAKVPAVGTPGPIMKIREKTERSLPMFGQRQERAPSDVSITDSRFGRPSLSNSRSSLLENSRPSSRAGSESSDRPTRIPSLRGKKGVRYNPPSSSK